MRIEKKSYRDLPKQLNIETLTEHIGTMVLVIFIKFELFKLEGG